MSEQSVSARLRRVRAVLAEDFEQAHVKLELARLVAAVAKGLGSRNAATLRLALLRRLGFRVGDDTVFADVPDLQSTVASMHQRLEIGRGCDIGRQVTFDLGEHVQIGDGVTIGHEVLLLTTSHELGPRTHRAGAVVRAPIRIGNGAWIGSRTVILPGITVGAGAVVAPGSLLTKDVPDDARVAGVPAKGTEKLAP